MNILNIMNIFQHNISIRDHTYISACPSHHPNMYVVHVESHRTILSPRRQQRKSFRPIHHMIAGCHTNKHAHTHCALAVQQARARPMCPSR